MLSPEPTPDILTVQAQYTRRRYFMRDVLLQKVAFRLFWKMTITGLEHIPAHGPTILMMNHSVTVDGIMVIGAVTSRFVVPMVKAENFEHPFFGFWVKNWGAYPVKRGEVDREALRITTDLLEAGQLVLIAPEGTRRKQLAQPKDGLAYLAHKTGATIVPTALFHADTWLGDLFKPWKRTHVHLRFGQPFRLSDARRRIPREELAAMTDEMMYQLAALLPENYRGAYSDLTRATTHTLDFAPASSQETTNVIPVSSST